MPNDDDVKRARELAIKAARSDPDQHEYTHNARAQAPWEPHRWVVNAIAEALQIGQVKLGQRATELLDHLVAPVREAERRTAGLLAEALKRIETLERAIPYGPEETLGVVLSNHRQRLDKLEKEASRAERGAILEVAARVGKLEAALHKGNELRAMIDKLEQVIAGHRRTLEGMSMTLGEQNQRAIVHVNETNLTLRSFSDRIGSLETWRKNPTVTIAPHRRPRSEWDLDPSLGSPMVDPTRQYARAPETVHPSHLPTIVDHQADAIEELTKDRERLERLREEFDHLHDRVRQTLDRNGCDAPTSTEGIVTVLNCVFDEHRKRARERDKARADVEQYLKGERQKLIDQRDNAEGDRRRALDSAQAHNERIKELSVQLESAKESGQRAHDDSTQVRQALATASKQRDNALRAADKAKAQRDGVRSTVIDQAREIGELRSQLRATEGQLRIVETTAKTLAGENAEAKAERTRRESDVMSAREQRLRESLGEATQLLEGLAMMCNVSPIGDRKSNAEGVRKRMESVLIDNRNLTTECDRLGEVARTADADRVPLRMDLDEANAKAKIAAPFVTAAQQWCNAWLHDGYRVSIDRPMSSAMVAQTCELMEKCSTYETEMAAHLNEIPF